MVIRILCWAAVAALVLSSVASAQTTIPHATKRCGGVRALHVPGKPSVHLPQRAFSIGESGFCSEYATHGWEATMHLHLGEGASDFLPQIEMAVDLWNTALEGFARRPVINIIRNVRPKTFRLESGFWRNGGSQSSRLVDDGQSVIYFKASENPRSSAGFAHWRWDRSDRLREADVYINTADVVKYGPHLIHAHEVFRYDDTRGAFTWVDQTYLVILHEIGHALGLEHVPISGNIMSYNYMPRMVDVWNAPLAMLNLSLKSLNRSVSNDLGRGIEWFLEDRDSKSPNMYTRPEHMTSRRHALTEMYTKSVVLGEQDRMALMCIYDFEDWNHN